jgi:MFS family permease
MNFIKRLGRKLALYDDGTLSAEVSRNLRIIIIAVIVGQLCFATTGGSAFTGYIKALGASDFMLGILMAMPYCVRVMQLVASYILERTKKRKLLMCALGITSRLLWVPIALVPLFIPMEQTMLRLWSILIFYALSAVTGTFIDSSFFSLCADVVPMRIRGRFFSVRSKISMVFSIMAGLLTSFLLDNIAGEDGLLGYIVCFVLAGIFGAGDIISFLFMRFPPMAGEGEEEAKGPSLFSMIKEVLLHKPFMKLVFFWTIWSFSVNVMAPYFNVYMLEHLGMTFTQITLLGTIPSNIFSFLFVQRWGRMMDNHGYKPVLYICGTVGGLIPFVWIFSGPGTFALPVLLAQVLTGAVWTAIDLSSQNTIMNTSPDRNRSMYTAVYMVITQLCGVALGFVLGGFLLDDVFTPIARAMQSANITLVGFPITQYHFLMVLTGVLRLAAIFFFLPIAKLDPGVSTIDVIKVTLSGTRKSAHRNVLMIQAQFKRRAFRRKEKKDKAKRAKNGKE